MPALEASNDNAPAAIVDESDDDDAASAGDVGDPTRGPAIVRAVAAGVCVGATMLLAELGNDRARALLARPAPGDAAPAPPAEVMTADQAAAFLGVDRNTVYDAAGRGDIPHRRIGKRILFSRSQLVSWLGACRAARVGNG
ncbi:MAG: helix-turn-helix domain-containing protein [Myxococcales bacterium]|nr:helix-turn-helix domain-containing protein [Myxococcales bacterium]